MEQRKLILLAMRPSFLSGAICLLAVTVILAMHTWNTMYVASGAAAQADPGISVAAVAETINSLSLSATIALAQPWVYYVVLVVAAIAAGLLVFMALQATTTLATNVTETIDEARVSGHAHHAVGDTFTSRLVLRAVACAVVMLAWYATIVFLAPYLLHVWALGITDLESYIGWLQCVGAAGGLFMLLHVHIVLVRLVFLRPRVFGGTYQIMDTF